VGWQRLGFQHNWAGIVAGCGRTGIRRDNWEQQGCRGRDDNGAAPKLPSAQKIASKHQACDNDGGNLCHIFLPRFPRPIVDWIAGWES
jgi:hypothetical protein